MPRVLGIDFGTKHIGLAFGQNGQVSPLQSIEYRQNHVLSDHSLSVIQQYVHEERISDIVIGVSTQHMPAHQKQIDTFIENIAQQFPLIDIHLVDESRTTREAVSNAISYGISRKRRKDDHSLAACAILKRFFETQPNAVQ